MVGVVIPSRFDFPEKDRLLEVLRKEANVEVLVLNSQDFDHEIHRMWNYGARHFRSKGASGIAFLNDDIEILPGTMEALSDRLMKDSSLAIVYPDASFREWKIVEGGGVEYTEGIHTIGNMTGFCFMMKSDIPLPDFDESFYFHYGDFDLERMSRLLGYKVGRVIGVPVMHCWSISHSRVRSEKDPLIEKDHRHWSFCHMKTKDLKWIQFGDQKIWYLEGEFEPGMLNRRGFACRYGLPKDLSGLRIMEVGSGIGLFSWQCLSGGADYVFSVESDFWYFRLLCVNLFKFGSRSRRSSFKLVGNQSRLEAGKDDCRFRYKLFDEVVGDQEFDVLKLTCGEEGKYIVEGSDLSKFKSVVGTYRLTENPEESLKNLRTAFYNKGFGFVYDGFVSYGVYDVLAFRDDSFRIKWCRSF